MIRMARALSPPGQTGLPDPRADVGGLRAFVAVAREGSVARAAVRLGRTQPSISARLAALEAAWATRLFRREARGMALTPEGARLLPLAESSLRALEELDQTAGLPLASAGELRLGSGDALGRRLLPGALARLPTRHPDVEVYLREGPRPRLLEALRAGEIDVALVVEDPQADGEEGLDVEAWIDSEIHLLAPAGTLTGRRREAVRMSWLGDRRLVVLQRGSGFRKHLEAAFAARSIPFHPAVEVGNLSLVRRFVSAGLGVAPVPAIAFGSTKDWPAIERRKLLGVPRLRYAWAVRAGVPLPSVARDLLGLLHI